MKLLLDTHAWLWMQAHPDRLSRAALAMVSSVDNELYLSAASAWEIAIKHALGKITLPSSPAHYVADRMTSSGVLPLAVRHHHALRVAELPLHHRDPFDRLLVAQAQLEDLPVLTADRAFARYEVTVVWAA